MLVLYKYVIKLNWSCKMVILLTLHMKLVYCRGIKPKSAIAIFMHRACHPRISILKMTRTKLFYSTNSSTRGHRDSLWVNLVPSDIPEMSTNFHRIWFYSRYIKELLILTIFYNLTYTAKHTSLFCLGCTQNSLSAIMAPKVVYNHIH